MTRHLFSHAAFTALAGLALVAPAAAQTLEILPSGHPVVQVAVDGSAPRRFVIDTAASTTTILPRFRAELPNLVAMASDDPLIGASGSVAVETTRIDRLQVDGKTFRSIEILLLPPGPVDGLGVDGILGADVIASFVVEFDMPARQWRMAAASDAAMLEGLSASVPITLDSQRAPRLTIEINGVAVPAVLDTGARGTIINWAAANAIGLTTESPGLIRASEIRGASSHATSSVKTRLATLAIGAATIPAPEVRIADIPVFQSIGFRIDQPAVILGTDVLRDRRFVIDHPGGRLYVSGPIRTQVAAAQD